MAGYPGKIHGDYAALKRAGIPGSGDYRGPNTTFLFSGTRTVAARCRCGTENRVQPTPLAEVEAPCTKCRRITTQEIVF